MLGRISRTKVAHSRLLAPVAIAGFIAMQIAPVQAVAPPDAPLSPPEQAQVMADGEARAPYGWVEFCKRTPSECRFNTREAETITLTPQLWQAIRSLNTRVNASIAPMTDSDQWGVVERWDLPTTGKGDCEDYVLLKRKRLSEMGLPRRAMLTTVVLDEDRQGHAVLMLRTDRGDLILDNRNDDVRAWSDTPYVYIKRERQERVGWTSLGGAMSPTVTATR